MVLDADGLDALAEARPPELLRALLGEAYQRARDVLVPAVVCAEVCRGAPRTRAVESTLARHAPTTGQRPPVAVIPTDFPLARQVGAILFASGAGTEALVDAHVVAVCVHHGGGLVITADPHDIARLAQATPSIRIITRPAR